MLAAITSHFNFCDWKNRTINLIKFRKEFQGCDLFIVEASYKDRFVFNDTLKMKANENNAFIWQKERMLNHLVEQIPDKYDKIAWIDGDIIFENDNWAKETEDLIDEHGVVQLFENVKCLGKNGMPTETYPSTGAYQNSLSKKYHSGFAWATHRSNFPLHDSNICGTGDLSMCQWWLGDFSTEYNATKSEAWRNNDMKEALRFYNMLDSEIGCVSGDIIHLYHGKTRNRKYKTHSAKVGALNFDPINDITIDKSGLWQWTGNNSELQQYMTKYLHERTEDQ